MPNPPEPTTPHIIKRYTNRKLYDSCRSQYITLDDVAQMIREGEDIRIIDNRSKEDLTNITLAQIIFDQQKERMRVMPLAALRNLIQGSGELLQKLGQPVTQLRDEAANAVGRIRRGERMKDCDSGEHSKWKAPFSSPKKPKKEEKPEDLKKVVAKLRQAVSALQQPPPSPTVAPPTQNRDEEPLLTQQRLDRLEMQVRDLTRIIQQWPQMTTTES